MNLLITGAASGIGRASAQRMSKISTVILADIHFEKVVELANEIVKEGGSAFPIEVNVTDQNSVQSMMKNIENDVGMIDALFNNAGINLRSPIENITEDEWNRMMNVHVKGTFLCSQAVLPGMCQMKKGIIVNMSSDFAILGKAGSIAYATAKTAIYSLTKALAREFASFGIRVNALGPGPIDTPLLRQGRTEQEWDHQHRVFQKIVPMGRLGKPEEVASVLDFLLSERSGYMTGQLVHPNGGQVTW